MGLFNKKDNEFNMEHVERKQQLKILDEETHRIQTTQQFLVATDHTITDTINHLTSIQNVITNLANDFLNQIKYSEDGKVHFNSGKIENLAKMLQTENQNISLKIERLYKLHNKLQDFK